MRAIERTAISRNQTSVTDMIINQLINESGTSNGQSQDRNRYLMFIRNVQSILHPVNEIAIFPDKVVRKDFFSISDLSFELVATDGGEHGSNYSCQNVLLDDSSVYCSSKSKNVNILFSHQPKHFVNPNQIIPFVIDELVIKAPIGGYTSPIKDGLIFIASEPIPFDATSEFDNFTEEKYRMFMKSHLGKRWAGKFTPSVYFKIDSRKPCYVRQLKTPRSGTHILIKLLTAHGKGDNIDIQYIGFRGHFGKRSFPSGHVN